MKIDIDNLDGLSEDEKAVLEEQEIIESLSMPDYEVPEHLLYANWRELPTLVFDLETTDLLPGTRDATEDSFRIIQFCAYLYHNEKRVDSLAMLINPGFPIPEVITKITGITDEMVEGKPMWNQESEDLDGKSPAEAAFEFLLRADVLVAYNGIRFDLPGLYMEFKRAGLPQLLIPYVDPLPWAQKRTGKPSGGNKLEEEARRFGVSTMGQVAHGHQDLHDAETDVQTLAGYFWKARQPWPYTLSELLEVQERYFQEIQLYHLRKKARKRLKKGA